MFSTKRGGELAVGGLFIMQQLEEERAVALKKEITKYKNELKKIEQAKLFIENQGTITNNNAADVESQVTQRSRFDFPTGKPEGEMMKAVAYVMKIKSTLNAPSMRAEIRKFSKEAIELKYNVMLEKISDIENTITEKEEALDIIEKRQVDIEEEDDDEDMLEAIEDSSMLYTNVTRDDDDDVNVYDSIDMLQSMDS